MYEGNYLQTFLKGFIINCYLQHTFIQSDLGSSYTHLGLRCVAQPWNQTTDPWVHGWRSNQQPTVTAAIFSFQVTCYRAILMSGFAQNSRG